MSRSEFQYLQMQAASSEMSLKAFLQAEGVAYFTYSYWCRKVYYSSAILKVTGRKNQLATGLPSRIAGVKVIIGRRH
ncbi:MAG: hypothetical protein K2L17_08085 [Muribaculaceae bacterium]|nr:hypothetical protein [Muribaculaceae bacterium]